MSGDRKPVRSPRLPGGDLLHATLDRRVREAADRGGAGAAVGARWAGHVAGWLEEATAEGSLVLRGVRIDRVLRLDTLPSIAKGAMRHGLRNPDFLCLGRADGRPALLAADAKFSIETARAAQVSAEVVRALEKLPHPPPALLELLAAAEDVVPGVFVTPDFPLTDHVLGGGRGIVRPTAKPEEIVRVALDGADLLDGAEYVAVVDALAAIDDLPISPREDALAALYYVRLAHIALGGWRESTRGLLDPQRTGPVPFDEPALVAMIARRADGAASAAALVLAWDDDTAVIRGQRRALEQALGLPLPSKTIRELAEALAADRGVEPPSNNRVIARLVDWRRNELLARFGALPVPVAEFDAVLGAVRRAAAELRPKARARAEEIVSELLDAG